VAIKHIDRAVEISAGRNLLDVIREAGVSIRSECGGIGVCGKCKVRVSGGVSPPTPLEVKVLGDSIRSGYRLACQTKVLGDAEVFIPPESLLVVYRSADVGFERPLKPSPAVRKIKVSVNPPSLEDPLADLDRILRSAGLSRLEVPLSLLKELPERARVFNWDLSLVVWMGRRLIDVDSGYSEGRLFGVAVDIGTSKIVVHLVNLSTGETVAVESAPNPQAAYGADIISRLHKAITDQNAAEALRRLVIQAVDSLISRASARSGVKPEEIYEVVVVGNTVMHHLFLGLASKYLGYSPYIPVVRAGLCFTAEEVGLRSVNRRAVVYLLPNIAGYVGADAAADALAVDFENCESPCLLVDIGTNTEILLNTGREILAASTPAGPAFEGASMIHGMRAVAGAVDRVFIYFDESSGDYEVKYSTVGGEKPRGICGSGYIDALANLYRLGIVDRRGKFRSDLRTSRLVEDQYGRGFVVVKAEESSTGSYIAVYARDINELLLAKAAVASGVEVLLRRGGVEPQQLRKVFVAGSFGNYINIENAITIGLLPRVDYSKIMFVGNTAVSGAKVALLSVEEREKIEKFVEKVRYVELSADPLFREVFVNNLQLPQLITQ